MDKMDYLLENTNLDLNEKNKKYFSELSKNTQPNLDEDGENNIDTFKLYEDFMKEKEGILELSNELCDYTIGLEKSSDFSTKNIKNLGDLINVKNRIIMILENYQEQPGLLDPILNSLVGNIMRKSLKIIDSITRIEKDISNRLVEYKNITDCLKALYQIIYVVSKIRGFKTIIKFFPSEVEVFETVICFLIKLSPDDNENWFLIFTLIMWTSILGLIPFDIETIDTNKIIITELNKYYQRVLNMTGNIRDVCAYAASKFLTRSDMIKKGLLNEFIEWGVKTIQDPLKNTNLFFIFGILAVLCEIFKNGSRGDLLKYTNFVAKSVLEFTFPTYLANSGIARNYRSKLAQRIGLVALKPRFQDWKYKIQVKTLFNQLPTEKKTIDEVHSSNTAEEEIDYDIDFSLVELVIDHLLGYLMDKEYIVRWSCAKGIGRICERLSKEMVDDIYANLFKFFDEGDNEYSWQGCCLCIAELCKRGMILPDKLTILVTYIEKALIYEVNKGTFCSGSIVRDSACYVVWALARAYTTDIMKPHVPKLASSLILTILFDKDVNCRRAASAAFQEHVGRQGYFPHGIEIITEADYFTLGNKNYCYLNIATFIAQYVDYSKKIIDYLAYNRVQHVEIAIRQVGAETLGLLVPFQPDYIISDIITNLLKQFLSNNINVRHGSIIGLGYILVGLRGKWDFEQKARKIRKKVLEGMSVTETKVLEDSEYRKEFNKTYENIKYVNNLSMLSKDLSSKLLSVVKDLDGANLYRGKGTEIMRSAINTYLRLLFESELEITEELFIYYLDILIDNLKHPNPDLQIGACEAIKVLNENYKKLLENKGLIEKIKHKLDNIIKQSIVSENIYETRGYTMAIPLFNIINLRESYKDALESLLTNSKMKNTNNNDYETRKNAVKSICIFASKLFREDKLVSDIDLDSIVKTCIDGFEDYEIDKKLGDVGSRIRECVIKNLTDLMLELYNAKLVSSFAIFKTNVVSFISCLLKQISEKMNKIRGAAGEALQKFFFELKNESGDINSIVPHFADFKLIFNSNTDDLVDEEHISIYSSEWLDPAYSFNKIIPILNFKEYSLQMFEGLIISFGGITEDVTRCSLDALSQLISLTLKTPVNITLSANETIDIIYNHILDILAKSAKKDRVMEPLFNTISNLLIKSEFLKPKYFKFCEQIHKAITVEIYDTNNIHKVLSAVEIFYNLLFFERIDKDHDIYSKTMRSLLFLLCHKYPVVRKRASEKIYLFLMSIDNSLIYDIETDDVDEISILISETNWTEVISSIRENRNKVAKMLKINMEIKKKEDDKTVIVDIKK